MHVVQTCKTSFRNIYIYIYDHANKANLNQRKRRFHIFALLLVSQAFRINIEVLYDYCKWGATVDI